MFSIDSENPMNIRNALPDNDSLVWLASNYGIIALTIGNNISFIDYPLRKYDVEGVRDLAQFTKEELIVLPQDTGVIRIFNKKLRRYFGLYVNLSRKDYMNYQFKSLYLNENEIWGSVYGQGVFFSKRRPNLIVHPLIKHQLKSSNIIQILVLKNGNIDCYEATGQVYVFNEQYRLMDRFKSPNDSRIFQDVKNNLWSYSNKGFGKLISPFDFIMYLPSKGDFFIYDICDGQPNALYIASNKGLLSVNKNKIKQYVELGIQGVWRLHRDPNGNTWAGTSTQLILFKQSQNYPPHILKTFQTGFVTAILSTPQDSNLWVATLTGLRKFNRFTLQEDKRIKFPPALNHAIQAMAFDHQGTLWLGGNRGIFAYNPKTGALRHLTQRDGLQSSEFNPGAMQVDALGNIWAGGNNGVDVINPKILQQKSDPPQLAITGLKIYDKEWRGATAIEETQRIRLPYDQNTLKFELAAMEYTDPARNQFKVFLKNYDRQWSNLGTQNFITYANLPPGKYQFMFTASNAQGIWQKQVKKLDILITPPYWRTWWFITLIVLAVAALIYSFFRYREQQRKKQEQIRQQIARDLHDEMGSTLSSISILSDSILRNLTQDINARQMNIISVRAREVMEMMSDIVWSVNPMNDQMGRILLHMREYASEVLEAKEVEYFFEVDKWVEKVHLPMELRKDFYLIFKEAINNSAKYSAATQVSIKLNKFEERISLEIKDNGRGFDLQKIKQGNGLKNMQSRAARMEGKLQIESSLGHGTLINLSFPIT